ncbi:phBC6A51 family helix-turn-helix protein [Streptococcus parauberis]|uniref:phBC6A51 family helix-turn-helix protein n=1 Tax=Streptococcus parauberis TaxID=1348 RepID=UPI000789B8CA|nr:phBC6A51 family helix-turn-helix protein [Streptococcus parauberis]KYP17743.1 Helix-turn-helix domain of resolvase [Streptococcus parauberis]KYP18602.1 Helix-turn-helix domain of resolvase [Streptococcus parauberis]KYP20005.1 Helix-turn-helix domain of resolvase [Streptococcus parauberis]KYP27336.1 Helix-turn-helix domain of resolvase [Streptococcus parauberis]KYP27602.1 Helix-turn-helix domain of resolvase [Streptococcus parauberis]
MSKNKYNISEKKLEKALELLALKEMSDTAIAQEVGISRNTLKRIKDDPEHQELFKTESESNIKMASQKAANKLIKLLDAKSELVSFQASQLILELSGIQVTDKQEISIDEPIVLTNSWLDDAKKDN